MTRRIKSWLQLATEALNQTRCETPTRSVELLIEVCLRKIKLKRERTRARRKPKTFLARDANPAPNRLEEQLPMLREQIGATRFKFLGKGARKALEELRPTEHNLAGDKSSDFLGHVPSAG
jgi:hypothetical protein